MYGLVTTLRETGESLKTRNLIQNLGLSVVVVDGDVLQVLADSIDGLLTDCLLHGGVHVHRLVVTVS